MREEENQASVVTWKPSEESTPSAAEESSKMRPGFGSVDVIGELDKEQFQGSNGELKLYLSRFNRKWKRRNLLQVCYKKEQSNGEIGRRRSGIKRAFNFFILW